jgi:hypothetical protein
MAVDYQVDLRADYPQRSSRGWAVLTILLIKFLALIPHFFVLAFLSIAQAVVCLVAQVIVVIKGEYPEGMFRFVVGVLRWNTRVGAFIFSLTDRYPPFALREMPEYPIDVKIERPASSSRLYALFTLLLEVLMFALMVWFAAWLADALREASPGASSDVSDAWTASYNFATSGSSVLYLRSLAAVPHLIIVGALGIATFVVWIIVQWIILFTASYSRPLWDFVVGVTRWRTRVTAYTLGLLDRYPPFSFEPSLSAVGGPAPVAPAGGVSPAQPVVPMGGPQPEPAGPPPVPAGPPPASPAGTQEAPGAVAPPPLVEPLPPGQPPAAPASQPPASPEQGLTPPLG